MQRLNKYNKSTVTARKDEDSFRAFWIDVFKGQWAQDVGSESVNLDSAYGVVGFLEQKVRFLGQKCYLYYFFQCFKNIRGEYDEFFPTFVAKGDGILHPPP